MARAELAGEAQARLLEANAHQAWMRGEAQAMAARLVGQRADKMREAASVRADAGKAFTATYIDGLATYALDKVQNLLSEVGTIASFLPGPGTVVAAVANGANAAIYAARGKYLEAGLEVVSILPVGRVVGWAGRTAVGQGAGAIGKAAFRQVGKGVAAAAKFVDNMPVLGALAKQVPCPLRRMVSLPGCFAAGTPVLMEFGAKLIEQIVAGDRVWARSELDPAGPVELKVVEEVFERECLLWRLRAG